MTLIKTKTLNVKVAGRSCEISVSYRSASRDLLFFLHGLGCSKDSFANVWDNENFKEYSLLSIDLPGFGHSAKPDNFTYSMEDQAAVCESVLGHYPEKKLHFIGHSMGAAIGLLLSDDCLNSAISFVNIEGNLIGEDCGYISRKTVSVPYDLFRREVFPDLMARFRNENCFSLETSSPLAFYMSSQSLVQWSESRKLLGRFKNLKCKKVYFYGDQNIGMKILSEIDGIEKIIISNSGHFLINDNPRDFCSKLHEFLSLSMTI